jgi:hypothetical protein
VGPLFVARSKARERSEDEPQLRVGHTTKFNSGGVLLFFFAAPLAKNKFKGHGSIKSLMEVL